VTVYCAVYSLLLEYFLRSVCLWHRAAYFSGSKMEAMLRS